MSQSKYHVLAVTFYLRYWHPRFEVIGVHFGWVPRCVKIYYVVAMLQPHRSHVVFQFWHAWQVTMASLITLCHIMSRYRHAVASLPPRCCLAAVVVRCATLCFTVATHQPRVSFRVYKPSDMWHLIDFGSQSRTFLHASATPQSRCIRSCYAKVTLAIRRCLVIVRIKSCLRPASFDHVRATLSYVAATS